jgi:Tautomerase enzyme.
LKPRFKLDEEFRDYQSKQLFLQCTCLKQHHLTTGVSHAHIDIKCYPKGLSKQELQSFADDLTTFASQRLNTPKEYITIAYTEVPAEAWKESVFDTEIAPNVDKLLRKPQYSM